MLNFLPKRVFYFFFLIIVSILSVYYLSPIFKDFWMIGLLVLYFNSKDEPLWLAFFFVISDGFMGFFGLYEATITLLPGLPAIEIAQFYILLSLVKIYQGKNHHFVFYYKYLRWIYAYIVFLLLWGLALGIDGEINVYFRIFKLVIPMLLFFIIPYLLTTEGDYLRLFKFLFITTILAFFTTVFDLISGQTLASYLGAREFTEVSVTGGRIYRGFYNPMITLTSLFAALFCAGSKSIKINSVYINLVIVSALSLALLSATRGWIIGFSMIVLLHLIFVAKANPVKIMIFVIFAYGLVNLGMRDPVISTQIKGAWERTATVRGIVEGDEEALATQQRTTRRGPRVMESWRESPVFGWGFSTYGHRDGHVGNQNLLVESGIIGLILLYSFFAYFLIILFKTGLNYFDRAYLVFIVFFIGWFFIHSTSRQFFAFRSMPADVFPQAIFFSFGAYQYYKMLKWRLFDRFNPSNENHSSGFDKPFK